MKVIKLVSMFCNEFRSSWATATLTHPWLKYTLGQTTKPAVGSIFAFLDTGCGREDVEAYDVRCGHWVILAGEGVAGASATYMLAAPHVSVYCNDFWEKDYRPVLVMQIAPHGGVFLSEFTPTSVRYVRPETLDTMVRDMYEPKKEEIQELLRVYGPEGSAEAYEGEN